MSKSLRKVFLTILICTTLNLAVSADNIICSPDYSEHTVYPYLLLNYWSLYGEVNNNVVGVYTQSLLSEIGLPSTEEHLKALQSLINTTDSKIEFAEAVIKRYF